VILNVPSSPAQPDASRLHPPLPYLPAAPVLRGPSASILRHLKITPHLIRTLGLQLTCLSDLSSCLTATRTESALFFPEYELPICTNTSSLPTLSFVMCFLVNVFSIFIHLMNVRYTRSYHWLSQACLPHHYAHPSERPLHLAGLVQHRGGMRRSFPGPLSSPNEHVACDHLLSIAIDCAVNFAVTIYVR
jgi:hypothetical protein